MAISEYKAAIFRILLDLIKADDIISVDEINGLDEAVARFGISEQDKVSGCFMTLNTATEIISAQSSRIKNSLRQTMLSIAIKDGECCRAESLLLTLMDYICDGDASVVSMESMNRQLLSTQILYLENNHSLPGCAVLENDFEGICNIVKLGGLDLIYIPKVAEHFRDYPDVKDLKRLLSLVSPLSNSADLDNTIMAIKGMTTRFFYRNVVLGKLDMNLVIDDPCWVLRIPDSNVAGTPYINFMCLKAKDDVRTQLVEFVSRLNSRQGSYSVKVNDAKGRDNSFIYNGFYKALLDLMSVRVIDKWDIIIRLYGDGVEQFRYMTEDGSTKKCIMTIRRGAEEHHLPLTSRDVAFYLLLLCASASEDGGVDFRNAASASATQARYGLLYRAVSRRADEPLVWDPAFRIPMKSRICSAIADSEIARTSSLQDLYFPTVGEDGRMLIPIEAERVILESKKGRVRLTDSALYKDFLAL